MIWIAMTERAFWLVIVWAVVATMNLTMSLHQALSSAWVWSAVGLFAALCSIGAIVSIRKTFVRLPKDQSAS